jgi:hypothetical protein
MSHNPCGGALDTTVVTARGGTAVQRRRPAAHPAIDCFYVYPTVSQATGTNAPLRSTPEIVATVQAQAALFATQCRLFVPLYRQVTVTALTSGRFFDAAATKIAQDDVRAAWLSYLRRDNHGRGVVLIGHSQGAMRLKQLVETDIDPNPAVRSLLVSAILLGGQVSVATGRDVGGDFAHVPTCRRAAQTGCLVAYSSYATTPPAIAFFGRTTGDREIACVDPSTLLKHSHLLPVVPTSKSSGAVLSGHLPSAARAQTAYVSYPGVLRAQCSHAGNAHVLHVSGVVDGRDVSTLGQLGPAWGLHIADVNIDLGDLVTLVGREAAAYQRSRSAA